MKKVSQGFTLIEILVVVAILGILTAVVTNSIYEARAKAQDAKAKHIMSEFVNYAANYATGNNSSYAGLCASTEANNLLNSAFSAAAKVRSASDCISDDNEYVTAVPMLYNDGYLFCLDHTGSKVEIQDNLPVVFVDGSANCNNQ